MADHGGLVAAQVVAQPLAQRTKPARGRRLAPGIPLAAFVRAPVDTRLAALHASLAPASASGSDCPADWPQRQASRRAVTGRRRRSTGLPRSAWPASRWPHSVGPSTEERPVGTEGGCT